MQFLCSKTYKCYDNKSDNLKFSSKVLHKRILEESGDIPMKKYRKVLDDAINLSSTNRGSRTTNDKVARYEERKKGLSFFSLKRQVQDDRILYNNFEMVSN